MMPRTLPWLLSLPLALTPVAAQSHQQLKPGSEVARWSLKTSFPAGADLAKPGTLIALADFLVLAPAAEHRTAEFQSKRYPKVAGAPAGEGDLVRTRGYIRVVAGEPDGDYHMQLSVTPDTFDNCLVVEVPKDDAAFVKNAPDVVAAAKTVRDWVIAKLLKGADPAGHTMAIKGPAYVEVAGQLFFDSEHQAGMAKGIFRGKNINGKQLPSKTSWEIHPVTKMAFAPRPQ